MKTVTSATFRLGEVDNSVSDPMVYLKKFDYEKLGFTRLSLLAKRTFEIEAL